MSYKKLTDVLSKNDVIPAVTTIEEFKKALSKKTFPCIMVKTGDINTLPDLIKQAHNHNKFVMLHQDSIKGVARDKSGIEFYAQLGVDALITTKPQYIKAIKEAGMIAILCLFLIDSTAFSSGMQSLKSYQPDAVVVMPIFIPKEFIQKIISQTGTKVLTGGLVRSMEDIKACRAKGVIGIATGSEVILEEIEKSYSM